VRDGFGRQSSARIPAKKIHESGANILRFLSGTEHKKFFLQKAELFWNAGNFCFFAAPVSSESNPTPNSAEFYLQR